MPPPKPQPRAMFVAALALAASVAAPMAAQPKPQRGPSIIARRNSALRRILPAIGAGIVAAGRARSLFQARGAMWAQPSARSKIDARARAVIASEAVAAAIGPVAAWDDGETAAWVEASANHVTLLWRGEMEQGELQTRAMKGGAVARIERRESVRVVDRERFAAAANAAASALDAAGFATSGLIDIRWLQIGPRITPGASRTFAGFVASIGLKRRPIVWMIQPAKGRGA